jgi:carboxyl-terminal processing protease
MARFSRSSGVPMLFTLIIGGFIGWQSALYAIERAEIEPIEEIVEVLPIDLDLFWEVEGILNAEYVDLNDIDSEQELFGAIKGMVNSLDDPFTVFMTPEETINFQNSLEGTLLGIGAELTVEDDALTVIAPFKGSPAEAGGLKPADIIYKIDDMFVSDITLFEAISSIRGEEGTTVILTVIREDEEDFLELEIERAEIEIPSIEVKYYGEEETIAYLSVYQFSDNTEAEFDEAVQELLLQELDGMILDLRYNGGGFLDVSVDMLSDFIEGKKVAVTTKHREEEDNEIFYTNESARLTDIPLVVLVNKGSASASEIVAGAIQDHERGLILGEQTFGKGSVQVVEILDDGSSLRYTIAKWYTPQDRSIDDVGITPDMLVEITDEEYENDIDAQLNAAVDYLEEL